MVVAWALVMCVSQVSDVPTRDATEPVDVRPAEERPCLDTPDAPAALRCATPKAPAEAPKKVVVETPPPRLVAGLGVLAGALVDGANPAAPELAFTGTLGVGFSSGVGVVAVLHAGFAGRIWNQGTVHRYGLGLGVRFGDKSHLLLGVSPSLVLRIDEEATRASAAATVLLQAVLVVWKNISVLAMPAFTIGGAGVMGSLSGGVGGVF